MISEITLKTVIDRSYPGFEADKPPSKQAEMGDSRVLLSPSFPLRARRLVSRAASVRSLFSTLLL